MNADDFNQSNKELCVPCHNDACPPHVPGSPQLGGAALEQPPVISLRMSLSTRKFQERLF